MQAIDTNILIHHHAHIVTLCLEHGISELISGHRNLSRFAGLKIINPFAGP